MTIRTLIAMLPEAYAYWKLRLQIALDRMAHNMRMAQNRRRFPKGQIGAPRNQAYKYLDYDEAA